MGLRYGFEQEMVDGRFNLLRYLGDRFQKWSKPVNTVEIETDDREEVIEDVNVVCDEAIHEVGMVFPMVGDVGVDKCQDIDIDGVVKSDVEMVLDSIVIGLFGFAGG